MMFASRKVILFKVKSKREDVKKYFIIAIKIPGKYEFYNYKNQFPDFACNE